MNQEYFQNFVDADAAVPSSGDLTDNEICQEVQDQVEIVDEDDSDHDVARFRHDVQTTNANAFGRRSFGHAGEASSLLFRRRDFPGKAGLFGKFSRDEAEEEASEDIGLLFCVTDNMC